MRITETLQNSGSWPPPAEWENKYTLPAEEINIPTLLAATASIFDSSVKKKYREALSSDYLSNDYANIIDLLDQGMNLEPVTGSFFLPPIFQDKNIDTFFRERARVYNRAGKRQNRSKNYYVSVDPDYNSAEEKLSIITGDLEDGIQTISGINREELETADTIGYISVLDYLKQHYLTVFNVLTYPERYSGQENTDEYREYRKIAAELSVLFTRRFYQSLLGQEHDPLQYDHILTMSTDLLTYTSSLPREPKQFTLQECDHPLKLLSHVQSVLRHHESIDTILAIMHGGTQTGILTQYGFELQTEKPPSLHFIPLSLHSAKLGYGKKSTGVQLHRSLAEIAYDLRDRKVLVTEDNANTGTTAQMIADAVVHYEPASFNMSFVEIDPYRILYKQDIARSEEFSHVANFLHEDFQDSVGYLPIYNNYQIRKKHVWRLFNSFK